MVGGDEATFQRCLPVLEAIGERVMHTGDIGAGCICKISAQHRDLLRRPGYDGVLDAGDQVRRSCRYHRRRIP